MCKNGKNEGEFPLTYSESSIKAGYKQFNFRILSENLLSKSNMGHLA
jgi:hypothetical protein